MVHIKKTKNKYLVMLIAERVTEYEKYVQTEIIYYLPDKLKIVLIKLTCK